MLDLLVWAFWFILGAYSFWFFSHAKTFQPISPDDLALTWEIHKLQTRCTATRIDSLFARDGEIIGFNCECGYRFLQKRLVAQKANGYARTNIFAEVLRARSSLQNLGIRYSHIKEI